MFGTRKLFISALQGGVVWKLSSPPCKNQVDNLFESAKTVKGAIPIFSLMKPDTLYFSLRSNFPLADITLYGCWSVREASVLLHGVVLKSYFVMRK
jgi:hypothetical protein